ncbi:Ig-like domain-containing protein, partial [Vibrio alfacsensis]|uniref:Ig-like domain-containing protein n=1 Tax=Vibrio alfacsensis TaxID=1074311 RepID=UPI00406975BB
DTPLAITLSGSDVDGSIRSYDIVQAPKNGSLTGTMPELTYSPNGHYHGSDSFTFTVTDNDGLTSAAATVSITVTPVDEKPEAQPQNVTIKEDTPLAITLSGSDVDGSIRSYDIVQAPKNGSLTGTMPELTYSPNGHYHGSDSFTFTVTDNDGLTSVEAMVSIAVTPVDEKPEAQPQNVTIKEDTPLAITLSGSDVDGSIRSYDIVQAPKNGSLTGTMPELTYSPNGHYHGSDSFTFTVTDNDGLTSAEATVSITVTPVNDLPIASNDEVKLGVNEREIVIDVLSNDEDVDGDTLTIVQATSDDGEVTIRDNHIHFITNDDFDVSTTIEYQVDDGHGGRDAALVMIWVDLPEPPLVTAPPTVSIDANALFTKVALGTATAVDHYGNPLPVSLISGDPFFQPGSNTALWQACDEEGRCGTAEQSVLVRPLISLAKDQVILEGNEVGVEVVMNGPHFEYPVIIPYTVSGTADSDDHSLKSGAIVIESGSSAVLRFNVHRDSVVEGDENIELTLDGSVNPGNKRTHRITIAEGNLPPEITLTASQAGEQRLVAAYKKGEMTIHANLTDPNKDDSHHITWTADEVLEAHLSHDGLDASFTPEQLPVGLYSLSVRATDQSGESDNATIYLEVREQLPVLDGNLDSDGDNISDADEGYVDVDLDGIPDYLDQVTDECNVLPETGNYFKGYIIEGDPAVCLRVGKFSTLGVTGGGQIVDEDIIASEEDELIPDPDADNVGGIFDFIAYNLPESGQSFQIVLPQRKAIPAEAVYRKLVKSVVTGEYQWETLVEGEGNKIHSALGEPGYCPPPGGDVWSVGLTEGDWCVQLTLVDGGHYDNDGRENGSVVDPGGVAVMKNTNTPPVANDDVFRLRDGKTHLIDVLVNDSDADGDNLTITSASADLGEVMVNNDFTLSYTAPMDYFGDDAIQYTVSDGKGGTDQAVVKIDVYINHSPVAADDSVQAEPNKVIVIPVLDNDRDADGDTLTVNQAIATVGGVTVQLDGTLLYEPAKDYIGEVWIDYQVVDSEGDSTWAQVQIVIQGSTIVKTEGGAGGSMGQLWLVMLMIVVWLRKQKRAVSHVSLAVLCSLLLLPQQPVMASETPVRKHGSGPWFVSGNINYAVSDVSQSDLDRGFVDAGINARTLSLDEQRIAYSVGLGYFVTENWFVEGGYLNTGDVELTLQSADATSSAFYDAVEHIYPESGDGPYVQLGYKHWFNNSWAVTGKVGAFFWEGDYLSLPVNSGSGSGNDAPSSTDLLYGISVDYHLTRDWVTSIQAQRVEFDNYPTTMFGLNLAYHFGSVQETPLAVGSMDSDEDGVQDEQDTCPNTPVTHAVDDNGCSRWTTMPQSFEALVLFANDSTRIESQYKPVLNELAKVIDMHQPEDVIIRGYASSPASSHYNMDLSLRRAEAVRVYLNAHHQIDLQRLKVEAYGESALKNHGDSDLDHAQNRRVEVVLSYNEKHALIR